MVLKIPPPPQFAGTQWQLFNRWLIELTSILSSEGGIDPGEVVGLSATTAQVGTNTLNIAALQGTVAGQAAAILALQGTVAGQAATILALQNTVAALPLLRSGSGAPAAGLGNVGDWYGDTANIQIYVKTAVGVWTVISNS